MRLGNHQDDQIETFFIRFLIRRSSIDGLGAMRPKKEFYIRPFFETSKKEILDSLHENQISYQTDSTNESPNFLRNRLRTIVPFLQNCDQRFTQNALKTIKNMQETYDTYRSAYQRKIRMMALFKENKLIINLKLLHHESLFVQEHIVQQWLMHEKAPCTLTGNFIAEIIKFLASDRGGAFRKPVMGYLKKKNEAYIEKNIIKFIDRGFTMKRIITLSLLLFSYALLCMNENNGYLQKITDNLQNTTHLTLRLIGPQKENDPQDDIADVSDCRGKKYHETSFTREKEFFKIKGLPKPNFNQLPVPQFEDNPSKNNTPENSPNKKTPEKKRRNLKTPPPPRKKRIRKDNNEK